MEEIERSEFPVKDIPLLMLTGCINPAGMIFTELQNPDLRLNQYVEAINFYLEKTEGKVLFVENSGFDISNHFDVSTKGRLEVLTFDGNNYDKVLGKGYGEMLIIKYAIDNSIFVNSSKSICKITGRYKILNVSNLLKNYINSESNLMVQLCGKMKYSDSRFFIADRSFYEDFLINSLELINDTKGVYFEHVLSKAVLRAIISGYFYLPFKFHLRISGRSGTDNKNYNDSLFYWFPRNIIQMLKFKLFCKDF
ncbi:hypothetical protein H9X96_10370 [Pedobacter sp. N36a]|uniref:hypothetical protein n=1 Tax=Pedobacter sp. N36a TaxID=2767996 RepID=UPI0016572065|nr:hypothetical protein [Pedobacter sp. N36a]MBC8986177.1 hypothetical protein [Pedobacter sp. N36a]